MEDMSLKFLAETKRTETMNIALSFEETLQTSAIPSECDTSISIQEVPSEKASTVTHLEVIENGTDATFTLISNDVFPQSENEGNATFDGEVVDSQNLNKRNSHEEYNKLATKFPDKNISNRERNTRECPKLEAYLEPKPPREGRPFSASGDVTM
ncbi:unnamed protein product [Clavelina lepadiformis]|uniref:Uncharacterized protein n=1 Tax=Clavelina lepadiformis TaxID=159417 RepID=A0ABP0GEM9_CLALP